MTHQPNSSMDGSGEEGLKPVEVEPSLYQGYKASIYDPNKPRGHQTIAECREYADAVRIAEALNRRALPDQRDPVRVEGETLFRRDDECPVAYRRLVDQACRQIESEVLHENLALIGRLFIRQADLRDDLHRRANETMKVLLALSSAAPGER